MPTRMKRIEVSRNPFLLKKYYINIIFNLGHFIAAAEELITELQQEICPPRKTEKEVRF
jgi:hypothetical protein